MTSIAETGEVTWTLIDGVHVAWSPSPGPLRASLQFRVGKVDEHLPINGITHLVEHLTLFPLGQAPHYQNGSVRSCLTSFETSGEPAEVAAFLTGVCTNVVALPTDRLEAEVRVVEAEAARKGYGAMTALLGWRFGSVGPGLWTYDELATRTADVQRLQQWADRFFTRENAVLILSGPVPDGLRLPLPGGARVEVPGLPSPLPSLPAWFRHNFADVAASTILPRAAGSVAYAYALQHHLTERLRYDLGVAYTPGVDYDPYDGDVALLSVRADAHPDHVTQVAQVLSEVVEDLADKGVSPTVLDEYRQISRRARTQPESGPAAAWFEATNWLLGGAYESMAQVQQRADAMTPQEVQDAAQTARAAMLYGLPKDVSIPAERAQPAPEWSTVAPLWGREFYSLDANAQPGSLRLSPEGITRDFGQGHVVTVPFATCSAVLARPDGQRVLVAADGLSVTIEPTLWADAKPLVDAIDAATPQIRVPMPARKPEDVPVPATPPNRPATPAQPTFDSAAIWTASIAGLCALGGILLWIGGDHAPGLFLPTVWALAWFGRRSRKH